MATITYPIFKLHFLSPLHLSKGKDDYDASEQMLRSDKIKAAILADGLLLYNEAKRKVEGKGEMENFLDDFFISSAYPFYKDEYFFPKPLCPIWFEMAASLGEANQKKSIKKIQFIGQSLFQKILLGEVHHIEENEVLDNGKMISQQFANEKEPSKIQPIKSFLQQRVAIPKYGSEEDSMPFYTERLFFRENAGLFFLVKEGASEAVLKKLKGILSFIGDNGIGTDTSVGNGRFTVEQSTVSLNIANNADAQMALSLYCPKDGELNNSMLAKSAYQLIKRGGWIASSPYVDNRTKRKKTVYMFTEGSVFPNQKLVGEIHDLRPSVAKQHPVYRDGRAIFIPLKTK